MVSFRRKIKTLMFLVSEDTPKQEPYRRAFVIPSYIQPLKQRMTAREEPLRICNRRNETQQQSSTLEKPLPPLPLRCRPSSTTLRSPTVESVLSLTSAELAGFPPTNEQPDQTVVQLYPNLRSLQLPKAASHIGYIASSFNFQLAFVIYISPIQDQSVSYWAELLAVFGANLTPICLPASIYSSLLANGGWFLHDVLTILPGYKYGISRILAADGAQYTPRTTTSALIVSCFSQSMNKPVDIVDFNYNVEVLIQILITQI